jgi:hypothetical protein
MRVAFLRARRLVSVAVLPGKSLDQRSVNTITPEKITGQVMRLCEIILPSAKPAYVPVHTHRDCALNECFLNVRAAVSHAGGTIAFGWVIWIWPRVLIEAEHHAVWELPDGRLVDITPKAHGEQRILFLRDDRATFDFEGLRRRDNVRLPLSSNPAVRTYIDASAALVALIEAHSVGREIAFDRQEIQPIADRVLRAQHTIYDLFLKASDLCTCGSQRQVRKCCGIERARRPMLFGNDVGGRPI